MAPTNLSQEEKARILTWKTENVLTKEISRRTGRVESTIRRLVATARCLPLNVVPPRKPVPGRPRKTSKHTDNILRRETLNNPEITAGKTQKKPSNFATRCVRTNHTTSVAEGAWPTHVQACCQTTPHTINCEEKTCVCTQIQRLDC